MDGSSALAWAHRLADLGIKVHPVWGVGDEDVDVSENDDGDYVTTVTPTCRCGKTDCGKNIGKHPKFKPWGSTTDHDQIDAWWADDPTANLGVCTEGLTIVDVDPRNGGVESYKQIQADLAPTFAVRTGGGGWHEYYLGDVDGTGEPRGINIVHGAGHQVVGPGSHHWSGSDYELMYDVPMASVPTRVRQICTKRAERADGVGGVDRPDEQLAEGRNNFLMSRFGELRNSFSADERHHQPFLDVCLTIGRADTTAPDKDILDRAEWSWKGETIWDRAEADYIALARASKALTEQPRTAATYFDTGDEFESIFDGTYEPPAPTILHRDDGKALFYPAAINYMFGEDSIGKTWASLSAAAEVLNAGGIVVHLDWDDSYATNVHRLKLLGADREAVRTRYFHKTSPADIRGDAHIVLEAGAQLIIVDVVANAVSAADLNEDKASDYLKWATAAAIPWARSGACVILNDHVTKSGTEHEQARGSGAKRAGVDGVAYEIKAPELLFPGEGGVLRLKVQKDRHGGVGRRGDVVADLHYDADLRLTITEAEPEINATAALKMRVDMWIAARHGAPFTRQMLQDELEISRSSAAGILKKRVDVDPPELVKEGTHQAPTYRSVQ